MTCAFAPLSRAAVCSAAETLVRTTLISMFVGILAKDRIADWGFLGGLLPTNGVAFTNRSAHCLGSRVCGKRGFLCGNVTYNRHGTELIPNANRRGPVPCENHKVLVD